MHQINFNAAAWPNEVADAIVKVIAISDGTTKVYTIMVGSLVVANKLPATDPRVPLAQKIAADLPASLKAVADQAVQFGQPPAFQMKQDPKAKPGG